MSADVRVSEAGDQAYAQALLNPIAQVELNTAAVPPMTDWVSSATNKVTTNGLVARRIPGDQAKQDAGTEERVYGKAAIGSGNWKAAASHIGFTRTAWPALVETTNVYSDVAVSGALGKVNINNPDQPMGMNAAAFLLFKQDPAQAAITNEQSAVADEQTNKLSTSIKNTGLAQGPRAASLAAYLLGMAKASMLPSRI